MLQKRVTARRDRCRWSRGRRENYQVPSGEESIKGARRYRGAMASLLPISFGQVGASVVEAIVTIGRFAPIEVESKGVTSPTLALRCQAHLFSEKLANSDNMGSRFTNGRANHLPCHTMSSGWRSQFRIWEEFGDGKFQDIRITTFFKGTAPERLVLLLIHD